MRSAVNIFNIAFNLLDQKVKLCFLVTNVSPADGCEASAHPSLHLFCICCQETRFRHSSSRTSTSILIESGDVGTLWHENCENCEPNELSENLDTNVLLTLFRTSLLDVYIRIISLLYG